MSASGSVHCSGNGARSRGGDISAEVVGSGDVAVGLLEREV